MLLDLNPKNNRLIELLWICSMTFGLSYLAEPNVGYFIRVLIISILIIAIVFYEDIL